MKNENKLVVLTGPTAVGKTRLSILLARSIGGEIISADSMQVYRGMDIGSAKIRPEEMEGIPHHLIDILSPTEPFDVVQFQTKARTAAREIWFRNHIPILTGGTGFYIQSVLYDIDFTESDCDDSYRKKLQKMDPLVLHQMLEKADPASAAVIHPNNVKRTIRALEFCRKTGRQISEHNQTERSRPSPYLSCYFVLTQDRSALYRRIDDRVDAMIEEGLEEEVRRLKEMGVTRDMTSMKGLGYAQMLQYLDGEIPYEEAVRLIKRDTRRFAKRQLTWFRRERDVIWIDRDDFREDEEILAAMLRVLKEKGILS